MVAFYIRFENTLADLQECYEHLEDALSESEEKARQKLVELCEKIAREAGEESKEQ